MIERFLFHSSPNEIIDYKVLGRWQTLAHRVSAPGETTIYWSRYEPKNFGDWITPYLYSKMTGRTPCYQRPMSGFKVILGAGSILRHIRALHSAVIWGSGIISVKDKFCPPREVLCVRGKFTRDLLRDRNIKCPESFGDPGVLLPRVFRPDVGGAKYALGVIPHFIEMEYISKFIGKFNTREVLIIDPTNPIEQVVEEISSCDATVSSSLHGIIVSHAYGVPSGWVHLFPERTAFDGDGIKYLDYYSSVGLEGAAVRLDVQLTDASLINSLREHAKNAPIPDQENLRDNLVSLCPF